MTLPPQQSSASSSSQGEAAEIRLFAFDIPLLKQGLGELSDLSGIQRVLDVGCGSGEWVLAAAQAYPQIQIVGIDTHPDLLAQARQAAQVQQRENVSFQQVDSLDLFNGVDQSFDLVNIRFIAGFTDLDEWSRIIAASLRLLRPQGFLRLTEGDTPITTSPAFEHLTGLVSRALWLKHRNLFPEGRNVLITPLLRRLLQNAHCDEIETAAHSTEFSTDRDAHAELAHHFAAAYRDIIPLLVETQVTTQEEAEQAHIRMVQEMQAEDFCAIGFYLTAWGRKVEIR